MSDTPPAETGSGAGPVEDPVPHSSVSSEPYPPEPGDKEAVEQNAVDSRGDSANGALVWPGNGITPHMLAPQPSPLERIASSSPTAQLEANPALGPVPQGQGIGRSPVSPEDEVGDAEEAGDGAPPSRSRWAMLWPWGVHGVIETIEVLALALLMFLLVRSVAQNFVVDGGSMEPTFQNGEMLIVNKLAYRTFDVSWLPFTDKDDWRPFGTPQPGDVVVFKFPQDHNRDFIKRVVAVSGQTVEVRGGKVLIDGVERNEPYLGQAPTYDYGPTAVPEGQIFVLGDNRNNSYDSHSWGLLEESLLIGRAELRYWPFDRIGRIDHGGLSAGAAVKISPEASPSPSTVR